MYYCLCRLGDEGKLCEKREKYITFSEVLKKSKEPLTFGVSVIFINIDTNIQKTIK